jgi:hypothetical protein
LRQTLFDTIQRQVRLGFEFEQPPDPNNRVTIDPAFKDRLDNPRPVVSFNLANYVKEGMAAAKRTSDKIFKMMSIEDRTAYHPTDAGYVKLEGQDYTFQGADITTFVTKQLIPAAGRMPRSVRQTVVDDLKEGLKLTRFTAHAAITDA